MKKVILIGKRGSGKTTLVQSLNNLKFKYNKTQAIEYYDNILDTPGEYIENRRFYNALIVSSYDCDVIALVQDCTDNDNIFPPNFASTFNKTVIGIITKIDCEMKYINQAKKVLYDAGAERIFKVSALEGTGMNEIKEFLT